ncbi:hypothetical protein [Streptomyces sp. NPDC001415]
MSAPAWMVHDERPVGAGQSGEGNRDGSTRAGTVGGGGAGHGQTPAILSRLAPLEEVGLGWLPLGRPLSEFSGGERQRIKHGNRLHEKTGSTRKAASTSSTRPPPDCTRPTPTTSSPPWTGSSTTATPSSRWNDLDVIEHTDRIIDIGPDAGKRGGQVDFTGTPTDMTRTSRTHTAEHPRMSLPIRRGAHLLLGRPA